MKLIYGKKDSLYCEKHLLSAGKTVMQMRELTKKQMILRGKRGIPLRCPYLYTIKRNKSVSDFSCLQTYYTRAGENMKEYEVIWEIFNKCHRNQMRDVFVDEVEIEDPEEYIKNKFKGKEVTYEKTVLEDGTIIFDIQTSQIKQRCSFTEI